MNFSYGFSNNSAIFRWLGIGGGGGPNDGVQDPFARPDDPRGELGAAGEESIIPTTSGPQRITTGGGGAVGTWTLNLGYSLIRPRATTTSQASQNLSVNMTLKPSELWDMSWRTSYDLENGGFNDHIIRLPRDIHRDNVNFDFLQTASGNWSFRFEVRLLDNQDLKFDYQQRSLDRGTTSR